MAFWKPAVYFGKNITHLSVHCWVTFDRTFQCSGPKSSWNQHILQCFIFVFPKLLLYCGWFWTFKIRDL